MQVHLPALGIIVPSHSVDITFEICEYNRDFQVWIIPSKGLSEANGKTNTKSVEEFCDLKRDSPTLSPKGKDYRDWAVFNVCIVTSWLLISKSCS